MIAFPSATIHLLILVSYALASLNESPIMKKLENLCTDRKRRFLMSETETAANKSLVQKFYGQVFTRGDTSNIDS